MLYDELYYIWRYIVASNSRFWLAFLQIGNSETKTVSKKVFRCATEKQI